MHYRSPTDIHKYNAALKNIFLSKTIHFLEFSKDFLSTYYLTKWLIFRFKKSFQSGVCRPKNIAQNTFLMPLSFRKHVCRCSRRSVKLWHAQGIHSQDLLGLSFTHPHKQQSSQNSTFFASKLVSLKIPSDACRPKKLISLKRFS